MQEFRTIATFRSGRFPTPADGLPDETDPLVRWLVDELRRGTAYRVRDLEVDWGACLRIESGRTEHHVNIAVGDAPPANWMLEVQEPPRLLLRPLARRAPPEHARLIHAVHAVLRSDPTITDLRWHRGSAFGRGDLSTAAEEPDPLPEN